MKKIIVAGSLLVMAGVANAGLLESVAETTNAMVSSKESGITTEQAVTSLLKTKFQENVTTKAQVKANLGEPVATATSDSLEVWTYDINSVSNKLGTVAGIAKVLGTDTTTVEKKVELKFDGDVMKSYAVVDTAAAG